MKTLQTTLAACSVTLAQLATAHEGHGTPGTVGHDLQHQLWTFAAVVALGALLFMGERLVCLVRVMVRRRRQTKRD